MMRDFITGLQFLTRIRLIEQSEWSSESFGRSVKYFPLIGGIIGIALMGVNYLAECLPGGYLPVHVLAAKLIVTEIILTGGLHIDGLMDTADGLFSGRSRERMLEIMKDSRVGANGVMAFGMLILLKWSLILDIMPNDLPVALFAMPVLGRFAMVIGITMFPYARPEGIGKAFAQFAGRGTLLIAAVLTVLLVVPLGKQAIIAGAVSSVFTAGVAVYARKHLGGLTGDVYGAITELAEIAVLFVFLFSSK